MEESPYISWTEVEIGRMPDPQIEQRTLSFSRVLALIFLVTVTIQAIASIPTYVDLRSAEAAGNDAISNEPNDIIDDYKMLDETRPSVKILDPSSCANSIVSPGIVVVRGEASDDFSGIKKVEAFSETYPLNDEYPFDMAAPGKTDWSSWSIPVEIHDAPTRILVRATDNAGNENWDEVVINLEGMKAKLNSRYSNGIAFVEPLFTSAAYNVDGFYEFYSKYADVKFGQNITNDLNLMTAEIPAEQERSYFEPLLQKVKEFVSEDAQTTIIDDIDVHEGFIFKADGSNAYKALFLLHDEYQTQEGYDNLRRFVSNGGTIVFLDSNVFYAQVAYDSKHCTATLIKGHEWEFDGKVVRRSVSERYFNETREWVGSNYMINSLGDPIYFTNNPFNYTHFEENYVANPDATILYDYGLTIDDAYEEEDWHRNQTIATYELHYGKGKSIVLGIYGQNKADDPVFLDFFDKVVLTHALGNEYRVKAGDQEYPIYWKMNSGTLSKVAADSESRKLTVSIDRTGNVADVLRLSLPKELIDMSNGSKTDGDYHAVRGSQGLGEVSLTSFSGHQARDKGESYGKELLIRSLAVDGSENLANVRADQVIIDYGRIIDIPLSSDISSIEIYGTYVAPEFGLSGLLFVVSAATIASTLATIRIVSGRSKVR